MLECSGGLVNFVGSKELSWVPLLFPESGILNEASAPRDDTQDMAIRGERQP